MDRQKLPPSLLQRSAPRRSIPISSFCAVVATCLQLLIPRVSASIYDSYLEPSRHYTTDTSASTSAQGVLRGPVSQSQGAVNAGTSGASLALTRGAAVKPAPPPPPPRPPPPPPFLAPNDQVLPTCKKAGTAVVTLSSAVTTGKVWKGWGASLAWYASFIGGLSQDKLDKLLDLLFSPTVGLGLNIARFNIGGEANLNVSKQFNVTSEHKYRSMPGYKKGPGLPYDWTADAEQRRVLFGARARGADTFIAFSNSPPYWMTSSGDVAGAANASTSNLNRSYEQAFVDYLADVVQQYATDPSWNLTFDHLEPFNEPSQPFWVKGGNQEGCFMDPLQRARVSSLASASLAQRGLKTSLVGVDEWAASSKSAFSAFSTAGKAQLAAVHVHGYVYPYGKVAGQNVENGYANARNFARGIGKDVLVTEWGPLYSWGTDLGQSLFMARQIIEAVNYIQASAWCYWQPIDTYFEWSLVNLTRWDLSAPLNYTFSRKYFIYQHFTWNVSPGSIPLVPSSPSNCLHGIAAFYDPSTTSVSVFVVVIGAAARPIRFSWKGFQAANSTAPVQALLYRTSLTENYTSISPPAVGLTAPFQLSFAGRSFTTLVIRNVAPPPKSRLSKETSKK